VFTGIVQDVGVVQSCERRGGDLQLRVGTRLDLRTLRVGDSVCVQGCCLTATEVAGDSFAADVSRESLARTTLGALAPGARVNLEPALRAGDALGGHFVSGHVDAVARVDAVRRDARSRRLTITVPAPLARFLAAKGSVTVDGVSLTVNSVERAAFGVNIIPHTQAVTTLGELRVGARVNLEVDLVARYMERLMMPFTARRKRRRER